MTFRLARSHPHTAPGGTAAFARRYHRRILLSTFDHRIVILDRGLELVKNFVGYQDEVTDLRFVGAESEQLVVATNSDVLQVVDHATGDTHLLHAHTDMVLCLDVSRDGLLLVSGSKDKTVRLWRHTEAGPWRVIAQATGHAGAVAAVALAPRGGFLVTGSTDMTIKLWSLALVQSAEIPVRQPLYDNAPPPPARKGDHISHDGSSSRHARMLWLGILLHSLCALWGFTGRYGVLGLACDAQGTRQGYQRCCRLSERQAYCDSRTRSRRKDLAFSRLHPSGNTERAQTRCVGSAILPG